MKTTRFLLLSTLFLPLTLAGCDKGTGDDADVGADEDTGGDEEISEETGDGDNGDGDGDPGPVDTDEDGMTDEEEAAAGTDPTKKDTDGDNYWDPWEIAEGTDPLDYDSRIYTGFWPYNPDKNDLPQGDWDSTGKNVGDLFPRASFMDHHGDLVDIYDFTNFTINDTGQPSYFIFDLSAQWCGPCHNVANWIAGVDNNDTAWIQETYPTVRDKVHSLRIWWITFIVENNAGGAPGLNDAESWYGIHTDNYVPILVDETQQVKDAYLGSSYPHFFLMDPVMAIEFFPPPSGGTNDDPYPAVGMVDKYL